MSLEVAEYRRFYTFGPIKIWAERRDNGHWDDGEWGGIAIAGTPYHWSWPISHAPGGARQAAQQSPAEELARALALIDGGFEVRRHE
jgi:hypothetical protein